MADISTELANIMSAIYGEEVRTSIHDAIQKMNSQLNTAASSTLNGLGFKGDLGTSDGTTYNLDSLTATNRRGIWRLQANRNYTNAPDDYDQTKTGYLIMYIFGTVDSTASNIKQEIHYFSDSGANANVCWSRVYISGSWTEWKKNVDSLLMTEGAAADAYIVGTRLNNITNKWGLMSVMEPVISDIDQIIAQGIYYVMRSSAPNWPFDNPGLLLVLNAHNANRETSGPSKDALVQIAFVDGGMAYRIYGTNAWGEWTHSDTDTTLAIEGRAADAKAVGDKALISKQVYLPVGDNANLNNFYTQGIYSVMSPQGTQNWPFENTWGIFVVLNANNATGSFSAYSVVQLAFCEGKYAFRTSIAGQSGPSYSDWVTYEIDDTLSIEGAAADAKAVGDAISSAVENAVSSKGLAMSTDPQHPVKDLNDYKTPGIYYVGATRVTNWAFDDNYRGVLIVFNPMTSATVMSDSIVQMAFSNGELAYRMFNGYGSGQTELWSDWIKNDNSRLLEIIESIADVNSVQNEIEATTNQNYYLEKTSATTCTAKSSTGTELVIYSVAVTAKKNYRVTASNVASIDNAILAFATRALADNVGCTMLIDNTGGPTIDYSYSPTQDGYLFLSKGTNASMTYKIYKVSDEATLKTDKTLSIENMPADAKVVGDNLAARYSTAKTYFIGDYASYNGKIYVCTANITTPEVWNQLHWKPVIIADTMNRLKESFYTLALSRTFTIDNLAISQGSINGNTGEEADNYFNRIRTSDFIPFLPNSKISFKSGSNVSHFLYNVYDFNYTFKYCTSWHTDGAYSSNIDVPFGYVKFVFKRDSDTTLSPSEFDATITINAGNILAQPYDEYSVYRVGDYVIQDNKLLKCTFDMSEPEQYNPSHWLSVHGMDEVEALKQLSNESKYDARSMLASSYSPSSSEMIIERGTIVSRTGQDVDSDTRLRSKIYTPIDDTTRITFANGTNISNFLYLVYDKNCNLSYANSFMSNGTYYPIVDDIGFVRFIFKKSNDAQVTIDEYDATITINRGHKIIKEIELEHGRYTKTSDWMFEYNYSHTDSHYNYSRSCLPVLLDDVYRVIIPSGNGRFMACNEQGAIVSTYDMQQTERIIEIDNTWKSFLMEIYDGNVTHTKITLYSTTGVVKDTKRIYIRSKQAILQDIDVDIDKSIRTNMVYKMPPNYSPTGSKVPIVLWIAGTTGYNSPDNQFVQNNGIDYMRDEGYAVIQIFSWGSYYYDRYPGCGNEHPYPVPICEKCISVGLKKFIEQYNVDGDNIHIVCRSFGGIMGFHYVLRPFHGLKSVTLFDPCIDTLGIRGRFSDERRALVEELHMGGTNIDDFYDINTDGSSQTGAENHFYSERCQQVWLDNMPALIRINPAWDNLIGGTYIENYNKSLANARGWWRNGRSSATGIYTDYDYKEISSVPAKIIGAEDDSSTSHQSMIEKVNQLRNSGNPAEIHLVPSGGHDAVSSSSTYARDIVTALGIQHQAIPIGWIEAIDWIRRNS